MKTEDHANLLIVDDDETIQRLLVIAAKDHKWRPRTATTGHGALDALDPDIEAVVLDHGLPDVDGIRTLKRILERQPGLPVIMLTGLNDAETAVRALRAGAIDYLTKPFELSRLFELLDQARRERKNATGNRPPTLQEVERDALIATYRRTGGNKARTARELGISERSVYNLLARHGLK